MIRWCETAYPRIGDDEVLVRVRAAALNPYDCISLTGIPALFRIEMGLRKPKRPGLGVDFAGVVDVVGKNVTGWRPGDEVFGGTDGAFAEYATIRSKDGMAKKPANLTFEQAASVPVAAVTALQALRDRGALQPGQSVLVNGASGGVGTFAVQIAKALGAHVTAVCSTRNVELVRSLGADDVVDYTKGDFTQSEKRFDLMLDIAGTRSWSACRRVLRPGSTVVIIGGPKTNRLVGPLSHILRMRLGAVRSSQQVVWFMANLNQADLDVLRQMIEAGQVTPVIDKCYGVCETADAIRYMGTGHAQGKIVLTI
jgi:NADPH:quinone reductase-like Zn-dependent oxidoreductase